MVFQHAPFWATRDETRNLLRPRDIFIHISHIRPVQLAMAEGKFLPSSALPTSACASDCPSHDTAFNLCVDFAGHIIEEADCLSAPGKSTTRITESGNLVSLCFDDWFRLRGLLSSAHHGPCAEQWPPFFDFRAWQAWEAWRACGELRRADARAQFCAAVYALPGYPTMRAAPWARYMPLLFLPASPCELCGALSIRHSAPRHSGRAASSWRPAANVKSTSSGSSDASSTASEVTVTSDSGSRTDVSASGGADDVGSPRSGTDTLTLPDPLAFVGAVGLAAATAASEAAAGTVRTVEAIWNLAFDGKNSSCTSRARSSDASTIPTKPSASGSESPIDAPVPFPPDFVPVPPEDEPFDVLWSITTWDSAAPAAEPPAAAEVIAAALKPPLKLRNEIAMRSLEGFAGCWRCACTEGMDDYLRHLGVNAFSRTLATSIVPVPTIDVVDGRLRITTETPFGSRVEWLNLHAVEADTDPQGRNFSKVVRWRGHLLVSTFRSTDDPSSPLALKGDIVTQRWLDDRGDMRQLTTYDGVSFSRHFQRDSR